MVKEAKLRVLTKFQANLVIPKHYLWLYFNQRRGYVYKGDLYHIFSKGRKIIWGLI